MTQNKHIPMIMFALINLYVLIKKGQKTKQQQKKLNDNYTGNLEGVWRALSG